MCNIAITAGGTSENIDGVRKITNLSTGQLGWQCLKAVLAQMKPFADLRIFYIHTETAYREELAPDERACVEFIAVSDAENVYAAVDELTKTEKLDFFIHSMAISDFTYSYSVETDALADEIFRRAYNGISREEIGEILRNPEQKLSDDTKISSSSDILMALKTTRKVIPLVKHNNPETFLVGFKLLRAVPDDELLRVARSLAEKNGCDMVFANEASRISPADHTGYLVTGTEIIDRPTGKTEIAESIVRNMLAMKGFK